MLLFFDALFCNAPFCLLLRRGSDLHHDLQHRLGVSKSESLGREAPFTAEPPSDEHMRRLKALVESFGLQAQIGG